MLRENLFYGNHVAVDGYAETDAIWNWWGDPTGPYCPDNPGGQGDSIIGTVHFAPWYADTSFFDSLAVPDEDGAHAVRHYELSPAYPNPFNPATTQRFGIEKPGRVEITVYDLSGRLVRTLCDREYAAGYHAVELLAPWPREMGGAEKFLKLLEEEIRGQWAIVTGVK